MSIPLPPGPGSAQNALQAATAMPPAGWVQPAPVSLMPAISADQKLELLEYWRSIVKRKWAILALATVVSVIAAVLAMAMPPVYQATVTVLIEAGRGKILSIEEVYGVSQQREHYQTQLEIIKSREVAERTVRAMKLYDHPEFDPRKFTPSWRDRALVAVGLKEIQVKTDWTEPELIDAVAGAVLGSLSVNPVRQSQLVRVSIDSPDRLLAATLANTLAQQYIEAERDERYEVTQQVSQQLQQRLADLRQKLATSEKALQDYREQRGIVALGGNAQTVAGQTIGDTLQRLGEAKSKRTALESEYQQAKAAGVDLSSIPTVSRSPQVAETQRAIAAVQAKLAEMQSNLGPAHIRVIQAEAELTDLRNTLRRQQQAAVGVLTREYEAARSTEQSLTAALGTARGAVQNVNREEFQLSVLDREYQSNRQLYEMFMSRAKETNLAGDIQPSMARVVDKAIPPVIPIKPKKTQIVVVAGLLALLLGAMAALVLDRLDNTIKGGDDAETRLHIPVLAALPAVAQPDRARMSRLFLTDSHSHFAEGIRTARTGVMLSSLDEPHKTLLVTSSLPDEGKTTVAINLALAHAQTKLTLLIDCDMRRSQVGRSLGLPPGGMGLTNLVAGTADIDECLVPLKDSPLLVLPVGEMPLNPLDIILSQRFKETLADLSRRFDMIIIDSPPVELVSEALVLAPLATSTTLVVKAMSTPAPLARKSLMRLQRAGGTVLGVIVNQLDFSRAQRYYGEYGSSTYTYGPYGSQRLSEAPAGAAAETRKTLPMPLDPEPRRRSSRSDRA